jgi:hypothetical protein
MICDKVKGGDLARLENNSKFLSRWSSGGRYQVLAELRCFLVKKGLPQTQQGQLQELYFQLESWRTRASPAAISCQLLIGPI